MPYRNLTILVVLALSIPAIAYVLGGYVHVSTFPFGAYYHSAVASGSFISGSLLLAGSVGLTAGLVRPTLFLWFGERNRKTILVIYGLTLVLGVAVKYETHFLSKLIFVNEEERIALVYRTLEPGTLLRDARHNIDGVDSSIRSTSADISRFNRTTGYPYDVTKSGVEFSYPSFYPKLEVQSRIVAHLSAPLTNPDAVIERLALLRGDTLLDVRPPTRPEEVKVYKGFLVVNAQDQSFTPCGQSQTFSISFSPGQRELLENRHRTVVGSSQERTFVILTGAVGPAPDSFRVHTVYYQSREINSRCDPDKKARQEQ